MKTLLLLLASVIRVGMTDLRLSCYDVAGCGLAQLIRCLRWALAWQHDGPPPQCHASPAASTVRLLDGSRKQPLVIGQISSHIKQHQALLLFTPFIYPQSTASSSSTTPLTPSARHSALRSHLNAPSVTCHHAVRYDPSAATHRPIWQTELTLCSQPHTAMRHEQARSSKVLYHSSGFRARLLRHAILSWSRKPADPGADASGCRRRQLSCIFFCSTGLRAPSCC